MSNLDLRRMACEKEALSNTIRLWCFLGVLYPGATGGTSMHIVCFSGGKKKGGRLLCSKGPVDHLCPMFVGILEWLWSEHSVDWVSSFFTDMPSWLEVVEGQLGAWDAHVEGSLQALVAAIFLHFPSVWNFCSSGTDNVKIWILYASSGGLSPALFSLAFLHLFVKAVVGIPSIVPLQKKSDSCGCRWVMAELNWVPSSLSVFVRGLGSHAVFCASWDYRGMQSRGVYPQNVYRRNMGVLFFAGVMPICPCRDVTLVWPNRTEYGPCPSQGIPNVRTVPGSCTQLDWDTPGNIVEMVLCLIPIKVLMVLKTCLGYLTFHGLVLFEVNLCNPLFCKLPCMLTTHMWVREAVSLTNSSICRVLPCNLGALCGYHAYAYPIVDLVLCLIDGVPNATCFKDHSPNTLVGDKDALIAIISGEDPSVNNKGNSVSLKELSHQSCIPYEDGLNPSVRTSKQRDTVSG
eukprot:Gb_06533 [translate_table: standard]